MTAFAGLSVRSKAPGAAPAGDYEDSPDLLSRGEMCRDKPPSRRMYGY
jgi:hypothetical protein